jgi:hypothetical protein
MRLANDKLTKDIVYPFANANYLAKHPPLCIEGGEDRSRGTSLATVQKGHGEGGRDRLSDIGIIEQDGGRFSAQLERDALHRRCAIPHDGFAHGTRKQEILSAGSRRSAARDISS